MTDETTTEENSAAAGEAQANGAPKFAVQGIYLKDLSFETPEGLEALAQQKVSPKVNQDVETKTRKVADDRYEVVLAITVSLKHEDKTIYLIEVQQAGVFLIQGVDKKVMPQILNTQCTSLLFPYAREVVDNVVMKGGFPPLNLPPINFDALFVHAVREAQAKQKAAAEDEAASAH
ncbi:MAG: protein-export chaperone SecB [bacterium]